MLIKKSIGVRSLLSSKLTDINWDLSKPAGQFSWFAILAVGYPFLFFTNVLFASWWLYRRKRYVYLPLIVIVLGFQHFFNFFAFNFIDCVHAIYYFSKNSIAEVSWRMV